MNARHLLIALVLVVLVQAACKKSDSVNPVARQPAIDPVKTDSPVVAVSVTYPFTDTFVGTLSVSCSVKNSTYYTHVDNRYLFYVRHVRADSLIFISSDTISQGGGYLPGRYFYNSYDTTAAHSYTFSNYFAADAPDVPPPVNNTPSFVLTAAVLQVNWQDTYGDEIRQMQTTGGIHYYQSTCAYTGTLVAH